MKLQLIDDVEHVIATWELHGDDDIPDEAEIMEKIPLDWYEQDRT